MVSTILDALLGFSIALAILGKARLLPPALTWLGILGVFVATALLLLAV